MDYRRRDYRPREGSTVSLHTAPPAGKPTYMLRVMHCRWRGDQPPTTVRRTDSTHFIHCTPLVPMSLSMKPTRVEIQAVRGKVFVFEEAHKHNRVGAMEMERLAGVIKVGDGL